MAAVGLLLASILLALGWILARLPLRIPTWAYGIPPYATGTIAMYWVIERIGAFWS